jgi:hypothetical protein
MFVVELVVPFFLFAPRFLRHNAAFLLTALMVGVALTGNYTFFNALAIALCLLCFDDAALLRFLPQRLRIQFFTEPAGSPTLGPRIASWSAIAATIIILPYTLVQSVGGSRYLEPIARHVAPYRSLNTYGLFAVMTNPRPELIFEGSHDGRTWEAYEFPHKPGALDRRPTWVAPHQPRLDWQLWFAALGSPQQNRWVLALCEHLLRGTPEVLALLDHDPFLEKPPRFIRVVRYEYHFTDRVTHAATGYWWRRTPMDFYVPSVSLK